MSWLSFVSFLRSRRSPATGQPIAYALHHLIDNQLQYQSPVSPPQQCHPNRHGSPQPQRSHFDEG
jgi:hypothetical protein